jgi:uncharacterized protein (DUF433 family)/predicted HTH domain antitoxin
MARVRVQVDLDDKEVRLLELLATRLSVRSRADLLQQAVGTFLWIVDEMLDGRRIVSVAAADLEQLDRFKELSLPAVEPLRFSHYRYLTERPETGRRQLYLTGRNVTVGQLVYTMRANDLDAEAAAQDMELPLEQVKEALAYYETHRDLIESETEEDRRSLQERKVVQVEVPEEWLQDLEGDRSTVMREIVRLGVYQLRVRRALEMYQTGAGSFGYVAEKAGLSKRDLVREARARGIEPPFDEQTVHEELGQ